jgi:radical SAM superfamily enzyme YgiQ (UPF0313 family)
MTDSNHKKTISFVNANFSQGPKELNAYYLPYSVGVLWSYVNQFDVIRDNFSLCDIVWKREKIDAAVERLKSVDIVGFSCHIWNGKYCYALAEALKKANPDILIVFGGPEPPMEKEDYYQRYPFIDLSVTREGEITFKKLLEAYITSEDYRNIKGLIINHNGKAINTGSSERISNLGELPSPYLAGVFDDIIKNNLDHNWNVIFETNRGCPYKCTFCDWGGLTNSKVKKFDLQRVYDELEWFGKHDCDYISFTDANFGMFPERDSLIADKVIEIQNKYNSPRNYSIAWAKNQRISVVAIAKKMTYEGKTKIGLNLSVQSLDENVLGAIKRNNLEMNKIEEVFQLCEKNGVPLYTELILGLPEQTLQSFKECFWKLFRINNHTGIQVHQAELLENAEMSQTQRFEYGIEGAHVYSTNIESEIKETLEVVAATRDLPRELMNEAQVFSWFLKTFHINGITNYISRFLYKHCNVDYSEFYENFNLHIQKDQWLYDEIKSIEKYYRAWIDKGEIDYPPIGKMDVLGFDLCNSTTAKMQLENKHSHIFDIIEDFVQTNYDIPEGIYNELIDLQKNYCINYEKIKSYPLTRKYEHNILGYLEGTDELVNSTSVTFEFSEDKEMTLLRYCENLFFARRSNFGKAW